jgi:hypothetical protein
MEKNRWKGGRGKNINGEEPLEGEECKEKRHRNKRASKCSKTCQMDVRQRGGAIPVREEKRKK